MDIVQVIQNLGFPIACVVAMAMYIYKINNNYRDDIAKLTAARDENSQAVQESLNSNTQVLVELTTLLKERDMLNDKGD